MSKFEGLEYLKKDFKENMLNSDEKLNLKYGRLHLVFHIHRIDDDGYDSNDGDDDFIDLNKKGYDIFKENCNEKGIVNFEFLESVINTNLGRSRCCNGKHTVTIDLQEGKCYTI